MPDIKALEAAVQAFRGRHGPSSGVGSRSSARLTGICSSKLMHPPESSTHSSLKLRKTTRANLVGNGESHGLRQVLALLRVVAF